MITPSQEMHASRIAPSTLAKVSLFLYLFFSFFGTSLPFQDRTPDVADLTTSNAFNQLVFSCLYAMSSIALFPKRHLAIRLVKTEKFLSLFLLWTLLSVLWSDFPLISFKRWIQVLGMTMVFSSAFLHLGSSEETLGYFKRILILYIPITFLSIAFIPGAIQWEFPAWRGLAPHKNTLGQISLVALLIWSRVASTEHRLKGKAVSLVFWILSLILLVGSRSTTALLVGATLLLLAVLATLESSIIRPTAGQFVSSMMIFSLLLGLLFLVYLAPDVQGALLDLLGKDMTLTGRTDLWAAVFENAKQHFLWGCGFGSFWVVNSPVTDALYAEFVWLPTQAHSGYLDIFSETGLVGISLLLLLTVFYLKNLLVLGRPFSWKWLFIAILLLNVTETTLFRSNELTGTLFTFSYLALYADLIRKRSSDWSRRSFRSPLSVPTSGGMRSSGDWKDPKRLK